jgi:hypothetical protein
MGGGEEGGNREWRGSKKTKEGLEIKKSFESAFR